MVPAARAAGCSPGTPRPEQERPRCRSPGSGRSARVATSAASWRARATPTSPPTANSPTDPPSSAGSGSTNGRIRAMTTSMHTARMLNSVRTSAAVSSATASPPPRHHSADANGDRDARCGRTRWPGPAVRARARWTRCRASTSARPMPDNSRQLGSRSSAHLVHRQVAQRQHGQQQQRSEQALACDRPASAARSRAAPGRLPSPASPRSSAESTVRVFMPDLPGGPPGRSRR